MLRWSWGKWKVSEINILVSVINTKSLASWVLIDLPRESDNEKSIDWLLIVVFFFELNVDFEVFFFEAAWLINITAVLVIV